jgi:hypothetical protein
MLTFNNTNDIILSKLGCSYHNGNKVDEYTGEVDVKDIYIYAKEKAVLLFDLEKLTVGHHSASESTLYQVSSTTVSLGTLVTAHKTKHTEL